MQAEGHESKKEPELIGYLAKEEGKSVGKKSRPGIQNLKEAAKGPEAGSRNPPASGQNLPLGGANSRSLHVRDLVVARPAGGESQQRSIGQGDELAFEKQSRSWSDKKGMKT